ncbi:MAG: AAA family ATPase [Succinatimonas sp.]|nr:AAA family ATPase [Succinatimonas sp.]
MAKVVPDGVSSYKDLQIGGAYYVDKTPYIKTILESASTKTRKVQLFTRPRRFGKTLFLSTLKHFLQPNYENPNDLSEHIRLFKDTAIYQDTEFCSKYMGKYPVISLSFKDIAPTEDTCEGTCYEIAKKFWLAVKEMPFIYKFDLKDDERSTLDSIKNLNKSNFVSSELNFWLLKLCLIIENHTKVAPVVLIDEYDVPLAKCYEKPYYEDFRKVYSALLGAALKDATHVTKAFITGCLRVTKESMFTGFNNFSVSSLSTQDLPDLCGFTEDEVNDLLEYFNFAHKKDVFKSWYDGYQIGDKEIYCPWDVVSYLSALVAIPSVSPLPYWKNTGSLDLLKSIYAKSPDLYASDVAKLLNHEAIEKELDEGISFVDLATNNNPNYFWTLLFSAGYLTVTDDYVYGSTSRLIIPNRCVYDCFKEIKDWSFSKNNTSFVNTRNKLLQALFEGDDEVAKQLIDKALIVATSFNEFGRNVEKEAYYQSFMNGIFVDVSENSDYTYASCYETGNGLADIVITAQSKYAVILELKHALSKEDLAKAAETGLKQIFDKKYADGLFEKRFKLESIVCTGLSFFGKECCLSMRLVRRSAN